MKAKILSGFGIFFLSLAVTPLPQDASAQIVTNNAFLQGDFAEAGVAPNGSFGTDVDAPGGFHQRPGNGSQQLGFVADRDKDGWAVGSPAYDGDFFLPGGPVEGWAMTIAGTTYANNRSNIGGSQIPGALSNFVANATAQSVEFNGTVAGVDVKAVHTLKKTAQSLETTVSVTNTTGVALTDVFYSRIFDPDNNQSIGQSFVTTNTVASQGPADAAVVTSSQPDGSLIALASNDTRARVGITCSGTPAGQWDGTSATQTGTNTTDSQTCLAIKIDSIAAGATVTFKYYYALTLSSLDEVEEEEPVEEPVALIAPWNGFLNQTNVLSLRNLKAEAKNVVVTLVAADGTKSDPQTVSLAAKEQRDIIVNALDGFAVNAIGSLLVEAPADGDVDSTINFYRPRGNPIREAASDDPFEFSFSLPLEKAVVGKKYVVFNTFQPSLFSESQSDIVPNWLQILNPTDSEKGFTVKTISQNGEALSEVEVVVPAGGRRDHQISADASSVGLIEVQATSENVPYTAQLVRYGADGSVAADSYSFAQGAFATSSSSDAQKLIVTTGRGAQSWIAIANAGSSAAQARVVTTSLAGEELSNEVFTLDDLAQLHLGTASVIPSGESALVTVTPLGGAKIVSQVNTYYRDENGQTLTAKTENSRVATEEIQSFSAPAKVADFNSYFSQLHWVKLFNTANSEKSVTLKVRKADGSVAGSKLVTLEANKGTEIELFISTDIEVEENSYGAVELSGAGVSSVFGEILRVRGDGVTGNVHGSESHPFH